MNIGAIITLLKFFEGAGLTKRAPKDPSSKAGIRPDCGMGKKAILQNDQWVCVPTFK
jgi:hypothetical protein|tara:strand:- start:51 stop:221 length:171 start_codon:yes stop_codon:yes gene_type:complete